MPPYLPSLGMKFRATLLLPVSAAIAVSCAKHDQPPPVPLKLDPLLVKGSNAFERVVSFVGIGARDSGTQGARRAAEYLAGQLKKMGIDTEVDEFPDACPDGTNTFRNVIGRIPGDSAGLIVLGCHYDTKSGLGAEFKGANDSGSGVGLLIELAALLNGSKRNGPEVLVAFFDGEECVKEYGSRDGLHGSRRLAFQLRKDRRAEWVRAVIVLDMVGDRDLTVTLPRNSSAELLAAVFNAAREEGVRSRFSLHGGAIVDDHLPFLKAGMPSVDIVDFEYGSAPGRNDYWHTPDDTIDKLSAESLEIVGRVVLRVLNSLISKPGQDHSP